MGECKLLHWFEYEHLPPHLKEVSKPFGVLANQMFKSLEFGPELETCLRKLLEAKDAAVRAQVRPGG